MDHTQLVILLLIGLISFIQWIVKKSAEMRERRKLEQEANYGGEIFRQEGEPESPANTQEENSEDSRRHLWEALGLPQEDAPPPPIPRRSAPALTVLELPKSPVLSPLPSSREIEALRRADKPREHAISARRQDSPSKPSRFQELLGSRDGLRKAIILSEILGPPKSLRTASDSLI